MWTTYPMLIYQGDDDDDDVDVLSHTNISRFAMLLMLVTVIIDHKT